MRVMRVPSLYLGFLHGGVPNVSKTLRIVCYLLAATSSLHAQPRAKAWVSVASDGTLDPAHSFNSSGAINLITNLGVGAKRVSFPGLSANGETGGAIQVSSTIANRRCKASAFSPDGAGAITADIYCHDLTGALADGSFNALFYRESRAVNTWYDAYAFSSTLTPVNLLLSGSANWNSRGGTLTVNRVAAGSYTVDLGGFATTPNGGSVLVTALGSDETYCNVIGWNPNGADLRVTVLCLNHSGAATDATFNLSFFSDVAFGVNTASDQTSGGYAWTSDPFAPSYTPSSALSLNSSGGAITGNRSATGTYNMTFTGLSATNSISLATPYGGSHTCTVASVTGTAVSGAIGVNCVTAAGSAIDARYDVLHLTVPAAPTLIVSHTHTGNFYQGQNGATYTIGTTVNAASTSGTITATEAVPAGMTLVSLAGAGWACALDTCTRSDVFAAGASLPAITATVNISPTAPSPLSPAATVSGGGANPVTVPDSTIVATCSHFIPISTASFPAAGGPGSFNVTVASACGWTPVSNSSWVTVTTGTVFGTALVNYNVAANPNGTARTGTITAGLGTFFITQAAATVNAGLRFVPVTPCRVADTRGAAGAYGGPSLAAATARDFGIAGVCGVPANAQAYSLNLTVVPIGTLGYLSVYPAGQSQPSVSLLNAPDARVKANAAIVPAGTNGGVTLFASNATNVIIDINGYFVPASGSNNLAFYPVTPCRAADTRGATGVLGGPTLAAGVARSFPILSGPCGIPGTAQAYALNMTAVPPGPLGFLSTWPDGLGQPSVSTLNAIGGAVTANLAIVPAGVNGAINVYASSASHVIIDITGYFAPPGGVGALDFYSATPCRILDTRGANGTYGGPSLAASTTRIFPVAGAACGIPADAQAFSLNATVLPPAPLGFLSLWGGGAQPSVSTLNAFDGAITSNAAITPAGPGGIVSVIASGSTQFFLDINGYFR